MVAGNRHYWSRSARYGLWYWYLGNSWDMRGASRVHGIDIDTWCIENTLENAERNQSKMTAEIGGADAIEGTFDTICANINLNVLLADMNAYVGALKEEGRYSSAVFMRKTFLHFVNLHRLRG